MTQALELDKQRLVQDLPLITGDNLARLKSAERTVQAHRDLMAQNPAMTALQVGGEGSTSHLPAEMTIAAWNVERCLFPENSAAHLRPFAPSVVLLSEMDSGMARTAQRNTTADMARFLGMHYAYGVEFFEMDLGGATERAFCTDDFNAAGWHGNAILSAAPFERLSLIRLDTEGHWFVDGPNGAGDSAQPRLGGRMAVAGIVPTEHGPICVVSTHLESNAKPDLRAAQFTTLMEAVDTFAPDLPVIIGGDLNTGNHCPPSYDWRVEPLFEDAVERGYQWDFTAPGVTTRNSLITPHDTRRMKLDWFCARGFEGQSLPILSSIGEDGVALSDHDCVLCQVTPVPSKG